MASIAVEVDTAAAPAVVWAAVRDIGALHTRLVPGFVVATELVPGGRRVTFANGTTVVEPIVSLNEDLRRLVWTLQGGTLGLLHYNAAVQVYAREIGGSRVIWVADILPDEAAIPIGAAGGCHRNEFRSRSARQVECGAGIVAAFPAGGRSCPIATAGKSVDEKPA